VPRNARHYLLAGSALQRIRSVRVRFVPASSTTGVPRSRLRAIFTNLDEWATKGIEAREPPRNVTRTRCPPDRRSGLAGAREDVQVRLASPPLAVLGGHQQLSSTVARRLGGASIPCGPFVEVREDATQRGTGTPGVELLHKPRLGTEPESAEVLEPAST